MVLLSNTRTVTRHCRSWLDVDSRERRHSWSETNSVERGEAVENSVHSSWQ
ncbi:hypothetical protein HSB1_05480 [Halogranum salarium B-1]|uniref:Uncharacterized protein n=1 Tax=Halogranum salarium B-1 TaxID=1210908 RepID=J3F0C3_9EURY|nr:hypothetical protein HSB1_05480 [Halogranum salarium B-1]